MSLFSLVLHPYCNHTEWQKLDVSTIYPLLLVVYYTSLFITLSCVELFIQYVSHPFFFFFTTSSLTHALLIAGTPKLIFKLSQYVDIFTTQSLHVPPDWKSLV